jgi:drug/metabolite transporter (DMT)-like permease
LSVSARYLLTGISFALLWSSASSAGKIGLESAGGLVLFTVRFLLAGLLLLAWSWFVQRDRLPKGQEWKEVGVFGAFNTTIYLGVFIVALEEVTAGVTSIALAINPLLMGVMTALSHRKHVPAIQWVSILLGIVGVVIVSYPLLMNGHATSLGMFLMAACMVAYSFGSVYYASVKWELSRTAINGWQVFLGGLMLLPFALLFPQKVNQYDFRFWASEFWLVVPVSIGAVQLWLYLLKIDTVRASLWLFLCPIFGLGFAAILLDEPLSMYTAVGTLLVLVALFIGQRQPSKSSS